MKLRNHAVPAVYLVMRKDNKILFMRRQGSGFYDGWYSLPAGHVEAGELPKVGLAREMEEELGIGIDVNALRLVHTLYRTKSDESGDRVDMFFDVPSWQGEPTIMEPHKCDDLQWCSMQELPDKVMPHVRRILEAIDRGETFSEFDLPTMLSFPK